MSKSCGKPWLHVHVCVYLDCFYYIIIILVFSPMPEALAKRQKLMAIDCSPQLSTGKDENVEVIKSPPIAC